MNKKRVFGMLFVFAMFFVVGSVIAEEVSVEDSYKCLETELGDNCGGTNNVEQAVFNLLASAYDSGLQSDCENLLKGMGSDDCWGESDGGVCKIKHSALAVLGLDYIGEDVEANVDWLLSKKIANTGLTWYLEIDANNKTVCEINGKKITLQESRKITGSNPDGLRKAYNNYWFEITRPEKNFSISCDNDFLTTLLYKKPASSVYYVSSETQSASAHDEIIEKVEAYCFGVSGNCNYEGSLWAVFALDKMGEDVSAYIPYLSAMSDESANKKFLPSAFLYLLTGSDDYYAELINQQKQSKYWDESKNKFYDTSVALLAIQDMTITESESAKTYLMESRESSGCWNSWTSFILYSGWPKNPSSSSGGTSGGSEVGCEEVGYFCTTLGDCDSLNRLENYASTCGLQTCCEVEPVEESCSDKGGIVCLDDEACSMGTVSAGDTGSCCLGDCEEVEEIDYCNEVPEYSCEISCTDDQELKSFYSCDFGDVCCADKEKTKRSWWIIILLIVLIILVILAIIFRNQLKIWLFRKKRGFKSGKGPQSSGGRPRPLPPPAGFSTHRGPRQMIPRRNVPIRRASPRRARNDKDFDDTMKKLKEMSG
ncbi:hypothetical protein HOE04_00370 [archaeon]|jgi:hypothetical protein|nr:hypothetical protein [archaeon]